MESEPTPPADASRDRGGGRRFWGSVVASEAVVGVFSDYAMVYPEEIALRPLARRAVVARRDEIAAIEVERQWMPPFWLRSVFWFRRHDDTYLPKVFIPWRPTSVEGALRDAGWPVEAVQVGERQRRRRR